MEVKPLAIYDWKTGKRLAFLDNAYDVKYEQSINSLWTASFKLPYADEKKKYCDPLNLVEIWDIEEVIPASATGITYVPGGPPAGTAMGTLGGVYSGLVAIEDALAAHMTRVERHKYVGLFRIMPSLEAEDDSGIYEIEYTLEHVLSTLLDSSFIGYNIFGGEPAENTEYILNQILATQNTPKWVLNECEYNEEFVYEFEDMNLLNSLYYTIGALPDDHYLEFNTKNSPWELNLKQVSSTPVTDIRYKKNIKGIKKKKDPRNICTRLYIYGKDRLSIKSLNGGLEYLDSEDGIEQYGIITSIIHDDRFENVQALYDYGVALLERLDEPFVTYEIDIQSVLNASMIKIGDTVRVVTEDGLDQNLVVQKISKDNLKKNPNSGTIIIGEGTVDLGIIVKSVI